MGKKLPDGWLKYSPVGRRIEGSRFVAFKVPLKNAIVKQLPEEQWFTPSSVLETVPKLGLVVDLTNTGRYYSPKEFLDRGVDHVKIYVEGGGNVPPSGKLREFFEAVDAFLSKSADSDVLIGVHCTHGLNRTGYFVCSYLVERLNMTPEEAIRPAPAPPPPPPAPPRRPERPGGGAPRPRAPHFACDRGGGGAPTTSDSVRPRSPTRYGAATAPVAGRRRRPRRSPWRRRCDASRRRQRQHRDGDDGRRRRQDRREIQKGERSKHRLCDGVGGVAVALRRRGRLRRRLRRLRRRQARPLQQPDEQHRRLPARQPQHGHRGRRVRLRVPVQNLGPQRLLLPVRLRLEEVHLLEQELHVARGEALQKVGRHAPVRVQGHRLERQPADARRAAPPDARAREAALQPPRALRDAPLRRALREAQARPAAQPAVVQLGRLPADAGVRLRRRAAGPLLRRAAAHARAARRLPPPQLRHLSRAAGAYLEFF